MRIVRTLDAFPSDARPSVVALGVFDGVHLAHRAILDTAVRRAETARSTAVAFTFDPHPVRLLRPDSAPPPLTWTDRKAQLLDELGVTAIVAYPTDEALLQLSAEAFFARIVQEQLAARAMVEGPNFYFGRGRAGNVDLR